MLLVGHGSARNPHSRTPTLRLAEELRRRGCFAEVAVCFLKEPPLVEDGLRLVSAPKVFVVPNLASEGYLARVEIPARLGLDGPVSRRDGRVIHYTAPVGSHPRIPAMIARRVQALLEAAGVAPAQVCLLLVGHGSSKPGGSAATAERIAAVLRDSGGFGSVATAFLEQPPLVADWRVVTDARHIVVAPLLIAEGLHSSEDLRPLFGLVADDADGAIGPSRIDGRLVWMCRGIGADPEVADLILDRVQDSLAAAGEGRA